MEGVPAEVRAGLTVHLVSTVAEVLRLAFLEAAWPRPSHAHEPVFAGHSAN